MTCNFSKCILGNLNFPFLVDGYWVNRLFTDTCTRRYKMCTRVSEKKIYNNFFLACFTFFLQDITNIKWYVVFVVQKSIELITKAKKPVVLVGSQATLPPVPVEQLRKALEVGTCTSYTGWWGVVGGGSQLLNFQLTSSCSVEYSKRV